MDEVNSGCMHAVMLKIDIFKEKYRSIYLQVEGGLGIQPVWTVRAVTPRNKW